MSKLGDHFPGVIKSNYVSSQLKPGQIVRLEVDFERTRKTREKFLVLTLVDEASYLFCINSEIHEYIKARKHLLKCQIEIKKTQYDFLDHDSYINCSEIIKIDYDDIIEEINSDISKIKGKLNDNEVKYIIKVLRKAITIEPIEKNNIIESLKNEYVNLNI